MEIQRRYNVIRHMITVRNKIIMIYSKVGEVTRSEMLS